MGGDRVETSATDCGTDTSWRRRARCRIEIRGRAATDVPRSGSWHDLRGSRSSSCDLRIGSARRSRLRRIAYVCIVPAVRSRFLRRFREPRSRPASFRGWHETRPASGSRSFRSQSFSGTSTPRLLFKGGEPELQEALHAHTTDRPCCLRARARAGNVRGTRRRAQRLAPCSAGRDRRHRRRSHAHVQRHGLGRPAPRHRHDPADDGQRRLELAGRARRHLSEDAGRDQRRQGVDDRLDRRRRPADGRYLELPGLGQPARLARVADADGDAPRRVEGRRRDCCGQPRRRRPGVGA